MNVLIFVLGLLGAILVIFGVLLALGCPEIGVIGIFIGGLLMFGAYTLDNIYYPITYITSTEEVKITDKEDNRLYFKGTHSGAVRVNEEMYAILQEGNTITIKITDQYKAGKLQSTTYALSDEQKEPSK